MLLNTDSNQTGTIHLPEPDKTGKMPLEEAIVRRKSLRCFASEPISQAQLSQILWAAQGVTGRRRTVPSAGATYPLEIFVACGGNSLAGLTEGIYHYNCNSHSLSMHFEGDVRAELATAALGQEFMYRVPVDIVICVDFQRIVLSTEIGRKGMCILRWGMPGKISIFRLSPSVWLPWLLEPFMMNRSVPLYTSIDSISHCI